MDNDLKEQIALVTGGTDGIGKEIARRLASEDMRVIIVGSAQEKGERAERELRESTGNKNVHFLRADLSLMSESDRLADQVTEQIPKLYYLVHCAGVVRGQRVMTAEDMESNFAINYLSRFVLTERLLGLLNASGTPGAAARILIVGGAARDGKIHYDDPSLKKKFNVLRVVSQFCEANDVFVLEQARRLKQSESQPLTTITTLKVGVVRTNIRQGFPWWMKLLVTVLFDPLLSQTPQQIADSAMKLLSSPEYEGESGALFTHIKKFKSISAGNRTRDPEEGKRLWDLSKRLTAQARGIHSMP